MKRHHEVSVQNEYTTIDEFTFLLRQQLGYGVFVRNWREKERSDEGNVFVVEYEIPMHVALMELAEEILHDYADSFPSETLDNQIHTAKLIAIMDALQRGHIPGGDRGVIDGIEKL